MFICNMDSLRPSCLMIYGKQSHHFAGCDAVPFFLAGEWLAVLGHLKRVHVPVEVLLPQEATHPRKNGPCYDLTMGKVAVYNPWEAWDLWEKLSQVALFIDNLMKFLLWQKKMCRDVTQVQISLLLLSFALFLIPQSAKCLYTNEKLMCFHTKQTGEARNYPKILVN